MPSDKGLPLALIVVIGVVVLVLAAGLFFVFPFAGRQRTVSSGASVSLSAPAQGGAQLGPGAATPATSGFIEGMHTDPSPLSPDNFLASNGWRGRQDTTMIEVWAGVSPSDEAQGLVVFRTWSTAPAGLSYRPTPEKAGPVEIAGADGTRLTLRSSSGATFTFDALTGEYL